MEATARAASPSGYTYARREPETTSLHRTAFISAINSDFRRRARKRRLRGRLQTGSLTVVQRFGSSLNLNVHFHAIVMDGVYAEQPDGTMLFRPLPASSDEDVARLARAVCRKVTTLGTPFETRSFMTDALTCPKCHGRMKILAVITKPDAIRKILDHLGIPSEVPRRTVARPPPQAELSGASDLAEVDYADPPSPSGDEPGPRRRARDRPMPMTAPPQTWACFPLGTGIVWVCRLM
jgi:hypothetical protein